MNANDLPLILEPEQLEAVLGRDGLLIVDLGKADTYLQYHVPGAVHLDYARLVRQQPPAMGMPPDPTALVATLSALGVAEHTHVIAYDDEGGGRACRLLWTLELAGHDRFSLLNGGLHAWANEGHPLETGAVEARPAEFAGHRNDAPLAEREYLHSRLGASDLALLDARSPAEFAGERVFAARGGHIPGARNLEWTATMDTARNLRLRPAAELHAMLRERGVELDHEVIVYCQTHHRSAHLYVVLKSLGYERVKAYAGSWSEWGNSPDLPIET